jgi:CHAT domain-containing protein
MARNLTDVLYEGRSRIAGGRLDPALLERQRNLERRLNFKSQQLIRAAREKPDAQRDAALRTEVEELLADGGAVEAEIRDKDPQYADLWRPRIASLEEVQSLLGRGTVLVEFFLGDRNGYLWAVTADSVESFTLPGRAELEKASRPALELAGAYRRRASNPALQSALNRALARTSDMLLRPLTPYLTRPRWIVVGDGPIQYLPFAALPIPGRPQVTLGARREITSLPSASTLVALRREPAPLRTASKTAAVFADPVFDGLDPRVEKTAVLDNRRQPDPPAWNLARLPFSRVEADAIAALVPARSLLMATGFSANKRALTNPRIGEYRILHISAHTMLNDSVPELSGLALSQVDGRGNAVDGFLRLYEIYKLRLSDTELVVLSACKTGLGREVLGEGLISLARGFLYAGARRVLVSLWEVDDQATAELMSRFYRGMLGNSRMRPAAALEAAQSSMRMDSRWRDPYFWAGFVLVSDEE